ncbi:hypothetical protein BLA29_004489, partial [Euroglyphus maynei]
MRLLTKLLFCLFTIIALSAVVNSEQDTTFTTESDVTTVESVDRDLPTNTDSSTEHSGHEEEEEEDKDGDEDEEEDFDDSSEPSKANVEEEDYYSANDDDDDDDDEEEYDEPSCTVKILLENMNLTAMLPQDGHLLRQEYDEYMLSDDSMTRIRKSPSANHTFQRMNRLVSWFRDVADQQQVRAGITNLLHQNLDVLLNLELDSICINSIVAILVAIRRNEPWALKFVDSAPKIPSGLMSGVSSFLGSFDQCLSIESPSSLAESYTGQYCTVKPLLPLPTTDRAYHYDQSHRSPDPQVERLMRFYAAYNVQHYFQRNPALKFVELMKSKKGRVTNFGLCLPS